MGLLFLVVTSKSTQPIFPDAYPVHAHVGSVGGGHWETMWGLLSIMEENKENLCPAKPICAAGFQPPHQGGGNGQTFCQLQVWKLFSVVAEP